MSRWRAGLLTGIAVAVGLSPLLVVTADEYANQRAAYESSVARNALIERVDALMANGDFDRALALLREELARHPDDSGLRQSLGAALLRGGSPLKSRERLETLRALLGPGDGSGAAVSDHSTALPSAPDR